MEQANATELQRGNAARTVSRRQFRRVPALLERSRVRIACCCHLAAKGSLATIKLPAIGLRLPKGVASRSQHPKQQRLIRSLKTPMRLCATAHFRQPHPSAGKHSRQRTRRPYRKRKWLELGPRPAAILAAGGGAAGRNGSACAASRIRSRALGAALPAILLPQP